ncbi:BRO-N domain-containing protein [Neisseria sp. P0008.S010]|uniref:BRO-N domain-containing protein n=1 Tax=Neisseria sp. P0008.S010 TaxID=3436707 RepID=UPI003F7FF570
MNAVSLSFKNTHFQITDINGQPWLRGLQIASALGYKNPTSDITNLYDRNADEFTDSMTRVIELTTAGGKQQVSVFSLRGAHLLRPLQKSLSSNSRNPNTDFRLFPPLPPIPPDFTQMPP